MRRENPPDERQEAVEGDTSRSRPFQGPGSPLRVVVADDHPLLLEGVRGVLQQEPDMLVVGVASRGQEAVRLTRERQPDALVLDFHLPDMDAPEILRRLSRFAASTPVVIFSFDNTACSVRAALEAGAMGYILKEEPTERLIEAIRGVARGNRALTLSVEELVASHQDGDAARPSPTLDLTPRERDVLALVAQGQSNGEIALHLSIGIKTVETHRANLYRKLDVHKEGELIMAAFRHHLISL